MRMLLSELRKLLREAGQLQFTFEVYGPSDETYTVEATWLSTMPFDVEFLGATDETGSEVEISELEAMGIELKAKAFEELQKQGINDMDPPGTGWDEPY